MMKQTTLQDKFLTALQQQETMVTVFLMNGFQIRGTVGAFDPFTVVVHSDGKQNLIYKHAISTITPTAQVTLEA